MSEKYRILDIPEEKISSMRQSYVQGARGRSIKQEASTSDHSEAVEAALISSYFAF